MSTDADYCTCCDLPVVSCGRQAERRARATAAVERQRIMAIPGVFSAQYTGCCGLCHEPYNIGTPLRRDAWGYTAECCL